VRWRRSRRGSRSQIRSLVERLNALEDTDFSSPVTAEPVLSTMVAADRSWGLIRWFSIGLACACIVGGIALLAAAAETRAMEAGASPPSIELAVLPTARD
jgi:hypothetical protein